MTNHAWVLMSKRPFSISLSDYLFYQTQNIYFTILRVYKAKEDGNYGEET